MPIHLKAPGYSSDQLYASVTRLLTATPLCSMATRSAAGVVDINTAFFAFSPDLDLYFLSHPGSAHCRNLGHVPEMALTVFASDQAWGVPHSGLQLYGSGSRVPGAAVERARAQYAARFPGYFDNVLRYGEDLEATAGLAGLVLYQFAPARIKLLDEPEFGDEVFILIEVVR